MIALDYVLIGIFVFMSIVASAFAIRDKAAAKAHARRTPEATLMLLGLFFGAAAEFITMLMIRHKTKHVKFMVGLPIFIMLHIALAVAYIAYLRPLIAG